MAEDLVAIHLEQTGHEGDAIVEVNGIAFLLCSRCDQ